MQLTLHAARMTHHGASRLVQAVSAWSVKARCAPSRYSRDARVYGHTTTAMHDIGYAPPPWAPLPAQSRKGTLGSPAATRLGPSPTPTNSLGWSGVPVEETLSLLMETVSPPPERRSPTSPAQPRMSFEALSSAGTQSREKAGLDDAEGSAAPATDGTCTGPRAKLLVLLAIRQYGHSPPDPCGSESATRSRKKTSHAPRAVAAVTRGGAYQTAYGATGGVQVASKEAFAYGAVPTATTASVGDAASTADCVTVFQATPDATSEIPTAVVADCCAPLDRDATFGTGGGPGARRVTDISDQASAVTATKAVIDDVRGGAGEEDFGVYGDFGGRRWRRRRPQRVGSLDRRSRRISCCAANHLATPRVHLGSFPHRLYQPFYAALRVGAVVNLRCPACRAIVTFE